jgi:hypothetical protein
MDRERCAMGWLKELENERIYHYRNERTGVVMSHDKDFFYYEMGKNLAFEPGDYFFLHGDKYVYAGFVPDRLNLMTKITFEKNGRKGLRVKNSDGKQWVRSMSKENYMNGKGTESVLTKGCREKSDKVKEQIVRKKYQGLIKGA